MKINNYIPAYRFQGYTDAWELRKLGEVIEQQIREVDKPNDAYRRLSVRSHAKGTFHQVVEDPSTVAMDKLYIVKADDLIVNITFAWEHAIAVANLYDDGLLVSHRFPTYRAKFNSDITYIKYLVSQEDFRRKLEFISPGGAGRNRVMNKKDFINLKAVFPTLPEQEAIGSFFSVLDQLITLHQRKLDTLKEQKKTYLKLLFPAKGQTKPALRFQGFEDDWEVKRISDIGDIVTGNTPSTSNEDYYSKEGMMWVTPTDIDGLIITDTNKKLSPEGEKVSRIVPANSILVTCIASIGKNTLLFEAGSFNQQINAVVPNQSFYHPYFLLTQSYFWSESMKRIAPAATMQIINKSEFSNITVPLPSLPEQEAIGTFFQTLDQEISQVEDKLASLKELKKTLLRKLFV